MTILGPGRVWVEMLFAVIAAGGFVFAVRGGGVMGVVETVESVSHMASYIRIMAVGLAGAIFANAINGIVVAWQTGSSVGHLDHLESCSTR